MVLLFRMRSWNFGEQIRSGHIPTPFPTRMVIQLDFTAWGRKSMAAFL